MTQNPPAMWQFNGLVLLGGYLERLFVHDEVLRVIEDGSEPSRTAALTLLMAQVTGAKADLEARGSLPLARQQAITAMIPQVLSWYGDTAPQPRDASALPRWVAATSGALYGEYQINEGLIRLGQLFQPALADRCAQHRLFYQGRLQVVGAVVGPLSRRMAPPRPELRYLERWHDELYVRRDGILHDLGLVRQLVEGRHSTDVELIRL